MKLTKKAIGIVIAAILLFSFTFLAMAKTTGYPYTGPVGSLIPVNMGFGEADGYGIGSGTNAGSATNGKPTGSATNARPTGSATNARPTTGSATNGVKAPDLPAKEYQVKTDGGPDLVKSTARNALGDVDYDGTVTSADARLTLRASVKLELFDEVQSLTADTDDDGIVTASDARTILRTSVGL